jgi:hypothetical protein
LGGGGRSKGLKAESERYSAGKGGKEEKIKKKEETERQHTGGDPRQDV